MLKRFPGRLSLAALSIFALALGACSSTAASPTPVAGPATVSVQLQEWSVTPAANSAKAGSVTFKVSNVGPADEHEFVVLKTDLEPGALPVDANGVVSEEGQGIVVVNEIEDIPIGATQELAVTLAAGKYVLLCNIYDEADKEAHYKLGMRTAFTVLP